MRLRFLGTSAGELYPGLWCRCRNCQAAREGTDQDRRQSAALYIIPAGSESAELDVTQGVLIDFPSEIAHQAYCHHVDLTCLQHLLVTHSHGDHWFPYLLRWRLRPGEFSEEPPINIGGPRFTSLPIMHLYGNAAVEGILRRELGDNLEPLDLEFHRVSAGDTFRAGMMQVTALQANHDVGREEAMHYVLQDACSTLLYGLDGDTFLPQTRERLRRFRFDGVILESTYGYGDGGNHLNFARVQSEAQWFLKEKLLLPGASLVATHFSPHHCPPHRDTEDYLKAHNIVAAWDGLEVSLGFPGTSAFSDTDSEKAREEQG